MEGFKGFCRAFANAIELENDEAALCADTSLEGLEEWDSLGKFSFLALVFSEYDLNLDAKDVNEAETVGDLWRLIEGKIES
jgi:acyl carrier protein